MFRCGVRSSDLRGSNSLPLGSLRVTIRFSKVQTNQVTSLTTFVGTQSIQGGNPNQQVYSQHEFQKRRSRSAGAKIIPTSKSNLPDGSKKMTKKTTFSSRLACFFKNIGKHSTKKPERSLSAPAQKSRVNWSNPSNWSPEAHTVFAWKKK